MRASIVLSALLGLLFGSACGTVTGAMMATNFYEYHVLDDNDDPIAMVNRDGWQPIAELRTPDHAVPFYYRRPRVRLP